MSDCSCKGHYHNGGCSDQNVIWWRGAPHGIPVNPTGEEISEQIKRNVARVMRGDSTEARSIALATEALWGAK
jgi:hypothetical protein